MFSAVRNLDSASFSTRPRKRKKVDAQPDVSKTRPPPHPEDAPAMPSLLCPPDSTIGTSAALPGLPTELPSIPPPTSSTATSQPKAVLFEQQRVSRKDAVPSIHPRHADLPTSPPETQETPETPETKWLAGSSTVPLSKRRERGGTPSTESSQNGQGRSLDRTETGANCTFCFDREARHDCQQCQFKLCATCFVNAKLIDPGHTFVPRSRGCLVGKDLSDSSASIRERDSTLLSARSVFLSAQRRTDFFLYTAVPNQITLLARYREMALYRPVGWTTRMAPFRTQNKNNIPGPTKSSSGGTSPKPSPTVIIQTESQAKISHYSNDGSNRADVKAVTTSNAGRMNELGDVEGGGDVEDPSQGQDSDSSHGSDPDYTSDSDQDSDEDWGNDTVTSDQPHRNHGSTPSQATKEKPTKEAPIQAQISSSHVTVTFSKDTFMQLTKMMCQISDVMNTTTGSMEKATYDFLPNGEPSKPEDDDVKLGKLLQSGPKSRIRSVSGSERTMRRWCDQDRQRLQDFKAQGLTDEEIGERMNRTTSAIAQQRYKQRVRYQ
ncbi:hypothetical protein F5Y18DRAFT_435886 [Xylariaceae sp. FL1019]|nr:hypothetical protein F5Y18DRAFT_435886 [Xylariaceae sp. FL1019]